MMIAVVSHSTQLLDVLGNAYALTDRPEKTGETVAHQAEHVGLEWPKR